MKINNIKIMGVFATVLLLVIVITASFAYFGSFNVNLNNNVAVNVNSVSPGDASLVSKSAILNLQVPAVKMSQTNAGTLASEANAILTVELTGAANLATTCTYDVVYEYDANSNVYGTSPTTKNGDKEITIQVESPNGTNNFSTEKNFDSSSISSYNKSGKIYTLVSGVSITSEGTKISQDIKITAKYYNLDTSQDNLAGKAFTGKIYAVKNKCETKEIEYASATILKNNGGKEVIEVKGNPDFSVIATANEGMYAMKDDLGTSYYFRGTVDNNWVKFGKYASDYTIYRTVGSNVDYDTLEECKSNSTSCTKVNIGSAGDDMYWRIIRINGDGSIRMIYTGTTAPSESTKEVMTGDNTLIGYRIFDEVYSESVGYMYTRGEQHGTSSDSIIKTYIDNWYKTTSFEIDDASKLLVADEIFCNDRTASISKDGPFGEIESWISNGGESNYYFGAYERLYINKKPILLCPNAKDKFTVNNLYGNGALTYPVGLITADELSIAGNVYGTKNRNINSYLYVGYEYYSLSPYDHANNNPRNFKLADGYMFNAYFNIIGIRPVINLSKNAKLSGDGTYNDVYTVS